MLLTLRDGQWAVSDEGQSGPPESPAIAFGGQKQEKVKSISPEAVSID